MKLGFSRRVLNWFKALIHSRRFSQSWMGKNLSMIQLMELDACTHCAMCTSRCSVAIAFEVIPNINILPSEKIASIKALASGDRLENVSSGIFKRASISAPIATVAQWFVQ